MLQKYQNKSILTNDDYESKEQDYSLTENNRADNDSASENKSAGDVDMHDSSIPADTLVQNEKERPRIELDEDGFQTVQSGNKKSKRKNKRWNKQCKLPIDDYPQDVIISDVYQCNS